MRSPFAVWVLVACLLLTNQSTPAQSKPAQLSPANAKSDPAPSAQLLTEEEEKALAQQDIEPGPEVAGGALTNQQLTYIVIALAVAVVILVLK